MVTVKVLFARALKRFFCVLNVPHEAHRELVKSCAAVGAACSCSRPMLNIQACCMSACNLKDFAIGLCHYVNLSFCSEDCKHRP